MRVLRDTESIQSEIDSVVDANLKTLIVQRVEYLSQYDDCEIGELINFIIVEQGDSLSSIDVAMDGKFLIS